jgi:hypothetical protein
VAVPGPLGDELGGTVRVLLNVTDRRRCQFNARSERTGDSTVLPPMRGCDAACPQAPASTAAVWAGRPPMRILRIRRNRRTRGRSPTTKVASTDARSTIFPVSCWHSRAPMIGHGRPAKDEADLLSMRARPQTPCGPFQCIDCGHVATWSSGLTRMANSRGMPRLTQRRLPVRITTRTLSTSPSGACVMQ